MMIPVYLGELGLVINPPHFNKYSTNDIVQMRKIVSKVITSSCIKYNKDGQP